MVFGRRPEVHDTGQAWAEDRSVANSGVIYGDVTVAGAPPARSGYLHQVRKIAPEGLRDREAELTELARFCAGDGSNTYAWWRGDAWTGKSALMSWFVLHPPPGVRVVSFFVTARFAGNNDRAAFADVVLLQLAELLGLPVPAHVTEATREGILLDLLDRAGEACATAGERLVLLVDGLDEDRGSTGAADAHSIAALLPPHPPHGIRVIVSGRPHPPLPADVPPGHPLEDPAVVRPLARSARAVVVRRDAERDLRRMLDGTPAEQDVLGFLTAAAGGLTTADLAELCGAPEWRIRDNLGRAFQSRPGPRDSKVFLLAHEELQQESEGFFAETGLAAYRARLHDWADAYRAPGWPENTPGYLLDGYAQLLHQSGATDRLVRLATDPARQDRLLAQTGGDARALMLLATAEELIAGDAVPDLGALGRLAVHRDRLARRNSSLPEDLPVAWAELGEISRATELAQSLTSPGARIRVLPVMATALADSGQPGQAAELVRSIREPHIRLTVLSRALPAFDAGTVRAIVDELTPDLRAADPVELAHIAIALGDTGPADAIMREAAAPEDTEEALLGATRTAAVLTQAFWASGETRRAYVAARHSAAAAKAAGRWRNLALSTAIEATIAVGEFKRAMRLWRMMPEGERHRWVDDIVPLFSAAGEFARAAEVSRAMGPVIRRAEILAGVAEAAADRGAFDDARRYLAMAEELQDSSRYSPFALFDARHDIAGAQRATAGAIAALGDLDGAETLARQADSDTGNEATETLVSIARKAIAQGHPERARKLLTEIEVTNRGRARPDIDDLARLLYASAAARATGLFSSIARDLLRLVKGSQRRWPVTAAIADLAGGLGDIDLVGEIDGIVRDRYRVGVRFERANSQFDVVAAIAWAWVELGRPNRSEAFTHAMQSGPVRRPHATGPLLIGAGADALIRAQKGDWEGAEAAAAAVPDAIKRAEALAMVALLPAGAEIAALAERSERLQHELFLGGLFRRPPPSSGISTAGVPAGADVRPPAGWARRRLVEAIRLNGWQAAAVAIAAMDPAAIVSTAEEWLRLFEVSPNPGGSRPGG
ncbi:hypothetical protein ACFY36_30765 [Actinoplanes sp. NPDC000266]